MELYKDFEISIEKRDEQHYHAKVLQSLSGESEIDFDLPFSKLELENFILKIGGPRGGIRSINSSEMQTVREFGSRLFKSIFTGNVLACLISSEKEAKSEGVGLRIKLRLDDPELINIPWEFLYDASQGRFLALFENTPIVRYIDILNRAAPIEVKPPLSMLVMISSPENCDPLDVAREKANLENAVKDLASNGLINITWMEQATLPALQEHLLRKDYHIFHFIGHGGFDERSGDGVLAMEDEIQHAYLVSGERLAVLLGNQPTLVLAVLNACEGGRTSSTDPFSSVATTLVRTGSVSAVVGMQLSITDQAAITFARGLYSAISAGRPIDAAVTQARLAIFADSNDIEWGTPVLYMRSPDGMIFDIKAVSPLEPSATPAPAIKPPEQILATEPATPAMKKAEIPVAPAGVPPQSPPPPTWPSFKRWLPWAGGTLMVTIVSVLGILFGLHVLPASPAISTPSSTAVFTVAPTDTPIPSSTSTFTTVPTDTISPSPTLTLVPTRVISNWTRPVDGMVMVYIPEGDFTMGDTADHAFKVCQLFSAYCDNITYTDETPPHQVYLDAFWIDQTEVTNAMYAKCVESSGKCDSNNAPSDSYPAVNMTWSDASNYCKWAGGRLPTEAEWEKAARGTDGRSFPWGNSAPSCSLANYFRSSGAKCAGKAVAVGSFPDGAGPYGAYDMAGNVWEWVADWFDAGYYSHSPQSNPTGPISGTYRSKRGGSWMNPEGFMRTTLRGYNKPESVAPSLGFRCAVIP